jgi:hypothetical protein
MVTLITIVREPILSIQLASSIHSFIQSRKKRSRICCCIMRKSMAIWHEIKQLLKVRMVIASRQAQG